MPLKWKQWGGGRVIVPRSPRECNSRPSSAQTSYITLSRSFALLGPVSPLVGCGPGMSSEGLPTWMRGSRCLCTHKPARPVSLRRSRKWAQSACPEDHILTLVHSSSACLESAPQCNLTSHALDTGLTHWKVLLPRAEKLPMTTPAEQHDHPAPRVPREGSFPSPDCISPVYKLLTLPSSLHTAMWPRAQGKAL